MDSPQHNEDQAAFEIVGIFYTDYLQQGRTTNGEYQILCDRFKDDLEKKLPHSAKKEELLSKTM